MNQDNTIKTLLIFIIVLLVALGLRVTVFKDYKFGGKSADLSSDAVVNAVANKTSEYVDSTYLEKQKYNEADKTIENYIQP